LSGTITVKHNGETVPYVEIMAHDQNWDWSEATKFASSGTNVPWEIITKPFPKATEIFFRVIGYTDDTYSSNLFSLDVKDVTRNVHNADVSNIPIDLTSLKTITLSGTISGSYDGRVVPSMQIQAVSIDINNESSFLGETNVLEVGDNRPWSMVIEAFNIEARVVFSIFGFDGPTPWVDEQLFYRWGGQDLGVTVKNQDKSGIAITCHVNPLITLSGTIKITYDNEPVPIIGIQVHDYERIYDNSYLAGTDIYPRQSITPWSITMEGYKEDKVISFYIHGHSENHEELLFDFGWTENNVTIKDKDISGIVLDFGNGPDDWEDWWWW
jgi:hypothetical protein